MKKVLARIGIGNATVDTVLPSDTVRAGETVDAEVHIEGGSTEQEIGKIRFELETRYRTEEGYREVDIAQYTLAESLTIQPDERETRAVSLDIPRGTPVTLGNVDVWVETELDIELAVDPEDKDYLNVQPTPRLQAVFDALDDLGFSLHSAECEADPHGVFTATRRFVQEFEFRPTSGPFAGELDELEVVPRPGEDALELHIEVDRRGGVLSELSDLDERTVQTTVRTTDAGEVRDELESLIRANA
ncbi:SpoOM family protein [Haloferax sp. Atlit-10N]|uniref:sporulation protein n=1 Tax=unclassified Haloferax TaxID=2625095 RepID=UPI000E252754|nr:MULTISPECIES: sporulation protein [unclassified Haloferax]RDZ39827.1 SpoOM family protein [Haloferax sp. Atlit-16N]RDZ56646.1 SpoOM family protein [Haloferax sp. Atlit-10N]